MNRLFQLIFQFKGKQNTVVDSSDNLQRFGSLNRGWIICDCSIHSSAEGPIISARVVEIVPSNSEVAEDFYAQVFLVDPT